MAIPQVGSNGVSVFHMDFHKNLSVPKLTTQESYYSRKLRTYAFGIHSAENGKGTTYVWNECIAAKTPETLVSCLDFHLRKEEPENRRWNVFWADNTRSQNKNHTVAFYFDYLVASGFRDRIDYKFLKAGHSFCVVDRDGGLAEGVLRKAEIIETPTDYVDLINKSELFPNLKWIEPSQSIFKNYSTCLRKVYQERRKDIYGKAFRFSDIVYFNFGIGERIDPTDKLVKTFSHPQCVWLRKTFDVREEPIEVDFRRPGLLQLRESDLSPLNTSYIKPGPETCKDLKTMSCYLSSNGKAYYNSILT